MGRGAVFSVSLLAVVCGCGSAESAGSASVGSALEPGLWNEVATSGGPEARSGASMVYDSARKRIVLFGGTSDPADTWEWDGSAWTQVATGGPPARDDAAMAYDEGRHVTVVFGGRDQVNFDPLGDTWEWDGQHWIERCDGTACTGPVPQVDAAMAYDPVGHRLILAGEGQGLYGETWSWDGSSWTLLDAQSEWGVPAPMATDAARGRIVLPTNVGGPGAYEWDGASWARVNAPHGPPGDRYSEVFAYDPSIQRSVLFGGEEAGTQYGDTWEWDGTTWTLGASSGPSPRHRASLAYDGVAGHVMLAFGDEGIVELVSDAWHYEHKLANGTECSTSEVCLSGSCTYGRCCDASCKGKCGADGLCNEGAICDGDHTLTSTVDGTTSSCAPYRCDSSGTCRTKCGSVDDCASPAVCGADGQCVVAAPPPASGDSGGCTASGRPARVARWGWVLFALAASRLRGRGRNRGSC